MKYVAKFVFHERKLMKMADRANEKALRSCGAYVRKIARDFVKHKSNPNKHSEPLHSPYDHFGLKESIVFASDSKAAYIGPRYIKGGLANVARLHEFGGESVVKDIEGKLWDGVEMGDVAPVSEKMVRKNDTILRRDSRLDPKTGRKVVWIKIGNKRQAEHSTRLYHRMMKNDTTSKKLVKYAPRPYMHPALQKALPHLSSMWQNSIKP